MDFSKAKKTIHIKCPYCKKDLQYNGASIKSQKKGLIRKIEVLYKKQDKCTSASKKKEIQKSIDAAKADLKRISEDVHMLSQLSEMETLKIFKRKVRKLIGEETFIRLCEESEKEYLEENTFNYYDLAIQRFNHFDNI